MTLLMSSAKSNFTPEFGSVFFLIDECCCINFPCIQNESVTLISDVCAEGERERVLNALKSFRAVGLSGLAGFGSSSKYKQKKVLKQQRWLLSLTEIVLFFDLLC